MSTLVVLTDFQHPGRHRHFPVAAVAGAIGNESCSYLPQNDGTRVLHSESRFPGSYCPLLSSFLVLNSLISHRYHLVARAALFIPVTGRSQRHDRHRRRGEESNMIVIRERARAWSLVSISTSPMHAWTLSELRAEMCCAYHASRRCHYASIYFNPLRTISIQIRA